jgi:hypothetical protein
VVIKVTEFGADVVAVGSGTLNTSGLIVQAEQSFFSVTNPANGFLRIVVGTGSYYETISGPEVIGSGLSLPASAATGDRLGMGRIGTWLPVP